MPDKWSQYEVAAPTDQSPAATPIPPPDKWDKFATSAASTAATISSPPPLLSKKGAKSAAYTVAEKGLELAPTAGGITGAVLGAPEGGPAGAVAGAMIGGGAGESVRQLGRRALGFEAPATSEEAAGDIGKEMLGQGASEATGQAGSRVLRPVKEFFAKTAARGSRVPLLPSEAGAGGPATARIEGFVEHALPSAGIMKDFRAKQLERATSAIDGLSAQVSSFKGTPEELGKMTQQAIQDSREALKGEVNSAYKAIDDLTQSHAEMIHYPEERTSSHLVGPDGKPVTYIAETARKEYVGGVQPQTAGVKKTAARLLEEIEQQKTLMDPTLLGQSESMLKAIMDAPPTVPYMAMAKSRSDLLSLSRKLDEALPGKRAGIAKLLVKDMDAAITDAAASSGISGLPEQVKVANALTKEMHRKFEQNLVTKILDSKSPEMVTGYVKQSGLQELRDVNALLPAEQRSAMQAGVIRDLLKESIDPAKGMLVPGKFASGFRELGDERAQELFGRNYAPVKQLSDLLAKVNPKGVSGIMSSMHNWTYLAAGPTALLTAASGKPEAALATVGALAAETVFMRKLAKAITNPAKSARVVHYMQLGMHGAPYAVFGLAKLVNSESDSEEAVPQSAPARPPLPPALAPAGAAGSSMPAPPAR